MPARFIAGLGAGLGAVSVAAAVGVVALREPKPPAPPAAGEAGPAAVAALPSAPRHMSTPPAAPGAVTPEHPPAGALQGGFDVVRIERDGAALIAGRAQAGATVDILLDGERLAQAEAGRDGAFIAFAELAASDRLRRLDLVVEGRAVGGSVFIAPSTAGETPTVVRTDESGAAVLQAARREADDTVTLDMATARGGKMAAAGRAAPGAQVRLYAGGVLLAEAQADEQGAWRAEAEATLDPGATLRVDELAPHGAVTSRVEAPFATPDAEIDASDEGRVVVERGQTLWRLAEELYGDGVRYTVLYEANADRVRDPNLIYPGQVLDIPSAR